MMFFDYSREEEKEKRIIQWMNGLIGAVCIWWRDFFGGRSRVRCAYLEHYHSSYGEIKDEHSTSENIKKFQLLLYKGSCISQSVSTDSDGNRAVYGHYD